MSNVQTFACCPCCKEGAALHDHVGHGGHIEVNGHEIQCDFHHGADVSEAYNTALDDIAARFVEEASPSFTGIWREACDLLNRLVQEAKR